MKAFWKQTYSKQLTVNQNTHSLVLLWVVWGFFLVWCSFPSVVFFWVCVFVYFGFGCCLFGFCFPLLISLDAYEDVQFFLPKKLTVLWLDVNMIITLAKSIPLSFALCQRCPSF